MNEPSPEFLHLLTKAGVYYQPAHRYVPCEDGSVLVLDPNGNLLRVLKQREPGAGS